MNNYFVSDERMQIISGKIAMIFLGLTQTALLGITLYRRFFLGQSEENYSDISIVLMLSVFGYIAARLYYGAVLPVLSIKTLVYIYVGLVTFLMITLSIAYGLPTIDDWQNTFLPVVIGPAILISFYWLIAHLGKMRMEKETS